MLTLRRFGGGRGDVRRAAAQTRIFLTQRGKESEGREVGGGGRRRMA